ncbi:MAG TPA: hypothetical protein VGQ99_16045 [Tepidisphaeraceae bacterium]|nr:hypothetical protein [Tepidisphaeraceae bacterium]
MRMIAGSILILAAVVLYCTHWIGQVIHSPAAVGTPESGMMPTAAVALGVIGAGVVVVGWIMDRKRD